MSAPLFIGALNRPDVPHPDRPRTEADILNARVASRAKWARRRFWLRLRRSLRLRARRAHRSCNRNQLKENGIYMT